MMTGYLDQGGDGSGQIHTITGQGFGDVDGGSGGNTRRAPIRGIQIVEVVPEPGHPCFFSPGPSLPCSAAAGRQGN